MWLCIFWGRHFEETFENAQWRKVKQMQPMRLCLFKCKQFKETFENAQWRKIKQMQPVWVCILQCRQFEDSFENTQRRKVKQMQPVWLCILRLPAVEEAKSHWLHLCDFSPLCVFKCLLELSGINSQYCGGLWRRQTVDGYFYDPTASHITCIQWNWMFGQSYCRFILESGS